jgi:transcription antitermination factor NusG
MHQGAGGYLNWFALHVASNHERKVQAQLQFNSYAELTPFWIPDSQRISRFTKKPIERALFPGYVFAQFDPLHRTPILRMVGVIQVLSIDRLAVPIPDRDIENIRLLLAKPSLIRPEKHWTNAQPGDWVEIIHGPFTGLQGAVTYLGSKSRVLVWIQEMGSGASVEVSGESLMRVGRKKAA